MQAKLVARACIILLKLGLIIVYHTKRSKTFSPFIVT